MIYSKFVLFVQVEKKLPTLWWKNEKLTFRAEKHGYNGETPS